MEMIWEHLLTSGTHEVNVGVVGGGGVYIQLMC